MAPLVDPGTDSEDELPTPAKGVHRRSFIPNDGHPCL